MKRESQEPRRHSIRLNGFNYAEPGAYFVTIVTKNRSCLFGEIINGQMKSNSAGAAVARWWLELTRRFTTVETDEFIVMPNHCHGIIVITDRTVGADLCVGPPNVQTGAHIGAPLPRIVQWFKTMTTNEYIRGVKTLNWPGSEESLNRIRQYIIDNPARWVFDRENPVATAGELDSAY